MIRVALVDDQALVRAGFAALLDAEDDIEVVGEAADGDEALLLLQRTQPDVVLMDIRMPRLDGIEATKRIAADATLASVHVIILTTFELDEYVFEGLRAGAAGFLVKDTDASELIRAIRVVAAGDALLSPTVTRRLIAEFATRSRATRRTPAADNPDCSRARSGDPRRHWAVQRRHRRQALHERLHRQDPRHPRHGQTRRGDRSQLVVFAYESGLVRPGWVE